MPIQLIGKSKLGDLGFCQLPSKMGNSYEHQLSVLEKFLKSSPQMPLIMTSMTGIEEVTATNGEYFPKIRLFSYTQLDMFLPRLIYNRCISGTDKFYPGCDFIIWDSIGFQIYVSTFSREAPIIAFESTTGKKALGVILRKSLIKYGDYLFSNIQDELGGNVTVTLVTCNHFEYAEGSIPSIVQNLADKYDIKCIIGDDSEKNSECFHRGETGNHVVVMW